MSKNTKNFSEPGLNFIFYYFLFSHRPQGNEVTCETAELLLLFLTHNIIHNLQI